MTWLSLRQLRAQAASVYVGAMVLAVALAVTGGRLSRLTGDTLYDYLTATDKRLFYVGIAVLAAAPGLLGAFWGAPLVARELESGTHRLVWSQSTTRARWLLTKVGLVLPAAVLGVGAMSIAVTWWAHPIDGALGTARGSLPLRLTPVSFGMRGLDPVATAVLAVSLGVLVGTLLRRTVPAMAVTLGLVVLAQFGMAHWVRPHLLPPTRQTIVLTRETLDGFRVDERGVVSIQVHTAQHGDWVLSQATVDANGRATALPGWFSGCLGSKGPEQRQSPGPAPDPAACLERLTREGYRQRVAYQPAGRFWPLQWLESGVLLAVSGGLVLLALVRVRRLDA